MGKTSVAPNADNILFVCCGRRLYSRCLTQEGVGAETLLIAVRRTFVISSLGAHTFLIPLDRSADMATMENLWIKYSDGKFGYSVQRDLWRKTKGDFENFCRRIGWTTTNSEVPPVYAAF